MDTDGHGLIRITPGNGFRGRSPLAGDMMGCGERRSPTLHVFNHGWTRINPDKEEGNGLRGRSPLAGDFRILNRLQAGDKTGVRPILKAHWNEQQPFNLPDPESAGKIISGSSLLGNSHCWERGCKRSGQSPQPQAGGSRMRQIFRLIPTSCEFLTSGSRERQRVGFRLSSQYHETSVCGATWAGLPAPRPLRPRWNDIKEKVKIIVRVL